MKMWGGRFAAHRVITRFLLFCGFIVCLFLPFSADVSANSAPPSPALDITCRNMPSGDVLLDLLVPDSQPTNEQLGIYSEGILLSPDTNTMTSVLALYDTGGWHSVLLSGDYPITASSASFQPIVQNGISYSTFRNAPVQFKIIVVTEVGKAIVSNIVNRKQFNSAVDFDYHTGKAVERPILLLYIAIFGCTLPIALLIEGIILLIFRFSLKRNWKPFLLINLCMQLAMAALLAALSSLGTLISSYEADFVSYAFLIPVFALIAVKIMLYARFLKQHSIRRRVVFGIIAHAASLAASVLFVIFFAYGIYCFLISF